MLYCTLIVIFMSQFDVCVQQQKTGVDKRECCLQEIKQTEEKYYDTLESILQVCTRFQSVR